MRQTNRECSTPRDEFEFNNPVELRHRLVGFFPVAIEADHRAIFLIDHHDVRGHLAIRVLVVFFLEIHIYMVNRTHPVDVVIRIFALDLAVRFFGCGRLGFSSGANDRHISVQTRRNASFEFLLGDIVYFRCPLRSVEIRRRERNDHVIDRYELGTRTLFVVVVPQLHVLRATER